MTASRGTLPDVVAVFVFLSAVVVYGWTASPAMGWLDSPEIVAAAASLGVPHSPGHPLPVLLGTLGTLVPVGDIAFRVNLMSALAAGGAALAIFAAARRLAALVAPELVPRTRTLLCAAAALVAAFCGSLWLQGVRAEVYALEALLVFALLAVLLAYVAGQRGSLYIAGLLAGLALATHHFIALTVVVPGAITVLAMRARPGGRMAAMVCLLGIVGLAVLVQLPIRAARYPVVDWGAPRTAERMVWTVSAKAFHKAVGREQVSSRGQDTAEIVAALADQLTWPMLIAALLGLYLGLRSRRWRPAALLLAGVAACAAGGRVLIGFDAAVPDDHGYLMPAVGAVLLLAVAALAALLQALATRGMRAVPAVVIAGLFVLAAAQLARFGPQTSLYGAYASSDLSDWELDRLPPRSLLLASYFQTSFRLMTRRAVEGARPDVAMLDRSLLTYPGMAEDARHAYPELAELIDAPLRAGAPTPVAQLARLAAARPVLVELHINLDPAAEAVLVPAGPFARVVPGPLSDALRDQAEAMDAQARAALDARLGRLAAMPPGDRAGVRDALLWHDFVRLGFFCRQSRLHAARGALDHAFSLAPGDVTLHAMATSCGLAGRQEPP